MRQNSSGILPPDTEVIEKCASSIEKPEDRLRFLQKAISAQNEVLENVRASSSPVSAFFESRFLRWIVDGNAYRSIFEELMQLKPGNRDQWRHVWQRTPRRARILFRIYQGRYVVFSCTLVLLIGGLVGATAIARRNGKLRASTHRQELSTVSSKTSKPEAASRQRSYQDERVWLVEKTAEYERYSNGGRILTKFEVETHPRSYVALTADGRADSNNADRKASLPVGIIYHSSESDIVPFTSDNSDSIQARSEGLASYVRRNRSYNYLIDRYGEIYRIVRDDQAANHAGYSVWGDGKQVYIGLNESFIGICFESSSADATDDNEDSAQPGKTGQLTEAQIWSGRALTNILRSRFQIADANCTTHGLVSIDPQRGTIAHHHDWTRGFPFSAFNLSDKYAIAPVSIALFGFDADDEVLEKLGNKLWQGALRAQNDVAARAEHEGVAVGEWRKRQRELFAKGQEMIWSLRRTHTATTPGTEVDLGDTKDALRNGGQ